MAPDLAQLDAGQMPEAMDKYYGIRYPQPATLLDHLDAPLLILDEVGGIRDAQKAAEVPPRRGADRPAGGGHPLPRPGRAVPDHGRPGRGRREIPPPSCAKTFCGG